MSTDLRAELADAAARVPMRPAPDDLWQRGVRRRRRVRTARGAALAGG